MFMSRVESLLGRLFSVRSNPYLASAYWVIHPARDTVIIRKRDDVWETTNYVVNESLCYPVPKSAQRSRTEWLKNKYQMEGFVGVEKDDLVVDVGSFVGGFAIGISDIARQVWAIEPSPRNYKCLNMNIKGTRNIIPVNAAISDRRGNIQINLGRQPQDDSIITPDSGPSGESVTVPSHTLASFCSNFGIDSIDYLKVEAEGAEPEVLSTVSKVDVKKIAVDCSEERDGKSTFESVASKLSNYELEKSKDDGDILLFAKRDDI